MRAQGGSSDALVYGSHHGFLGQEIGTPSRRATDSIASIPETPHGTPVSERAGGKPNIDHVPSLSSSRTSIKVFQSWRKAKSALRFSRTFLRQPTLLAVFCPGIGVKQEGLEKLTIPCWDPFEQFATCGAIEHPGLFYWHRACVRPRCNHTSLVNTPPSERLKQPDKKKTCEGRDVW